MIDKQTLKVGMKLRAAANWIGDRQGKIVTISKLYLSADGTRITGGRGVWEDRRVCELFAFNPRSWDYVDD